MVAIGSVQATRHVLGLPGSVMALVAVVAGALGGPLVGLVAALAGGAVYAATVASFGARGEWPATIASITLWSTTALVSAALAVALRRQTTRLAEASEGLREAQRLALLGSWELDIVAGALTWSDEIYRIFEIDPSRFGASYEAFLNAIHPDDRESVDAAYSSSVQSRTPYEIDHRLLMPDGRIKHVHERCTTYYDEAGAPVRSVGTVQDITARKLVDEQLREASLYARSLIEASLDPLVTISPAGKITDVNAATEQVTGVPRQQLIGSDFTDCFTEPQEARAGYERVFEQGFVLDYPLAIRHASGAVTDVLYNASLYRDESGAVVGVFAAARDVTQRKRAEEALLQAEKALRIEKDELARSNAELEQFAYVASHDLQEPLRMVASYTQLLARRYEGKLDEEADEFIGYAVDGATRMQQLIRDLLAFSRVGTRGEPLVPMEAQAAYDEALGNLALTIAESGAEVSADPLPAVMGDHVQIVQLLQNLIGNGIKFRGDLPPRVHVSATQQGGEWLFSVADNGIGIDAQYFERVFVIFQRLHNRRAFPGTGIGLALCKKIVARHNGRIWVESEPDRGSTFHFTLPTQGEDRR
jgi:PAS domain S-box-containing protein